VGDLRFRQVTQFFSHRVVRIPSDPDPEEPGGAGQPSDPAEGFVLDAASATGMSARFGGFFILTG
jgi:hypothetical protein